MAAGALGLLFAAVGVEVLRRLGDSTTIPRLTEVHISASVVLVTLLISLLSAGIVSVLPMLRSRDLSLSGILAAHGPSSSGGRVRQRTRRALVAAQVALALVLLAGAGLFARSFARLRDVDPGFRADGAVSFRLAIPEAEYQTAHDGAQTVARVLDALTAIPGVRGAGVTTKLPLDEEARQDSAVFLEDRPLRGREFPDIHSMAFVTPGYFAAMGIPLVAGRSFTAFEPGRDPTSQPREVIVSEALAKKYWSAASAVGRRIRMTPGDPWATIVGVAGSVRDAGLDKDPASTVYIPLLTTTVSGSAWMPRDVAFVVRSESDPAAITASIRTALRSAAPALPIYRVRALRELESAAEARTTFTLLLLGAAAAAATLIGATGIFGVVAYLATLRRRELGVRLALGATPGNVERLFVRHAMTDAAIGVAAGLAGTLVLGRLLASALFGVRTTDPIALGAAAGVLLLTAAAASWIPARRAAALDPASALRAE